MSGYDDDYKAMVARIRAQRAAMKAVLSVQEPEPVEPAPVEYVDEASTTSSDIPYPFNVSLPKDSGGSGV